MMIGDKLLQVGVSEGTTVLCEKEKLFRTILPWTVLAMKGVVYSKYFVLLKGLYCLASVLVVLIILHTTLSEDSFGVAFLVFFNLQGLMYIATPYACVISFVNCWENDFIAHILADSFAFDPKLRKKFDAITYLNILLLIFSVISFTMNGMDASMSARVGSAFTTVFYLTPFVLSYSWFVCLVYAQWSRLERFLEELRHMRSICDSKYRAQDKFPSLRVENRQPPSEQSRRQEQEGDVEDGDGAECRRSGAIELPLGPVQALSSKDSADNITMSLESLSSKYYEELSICLGFSKCCGKWLFFFTIFSLFFAVGVVWALYLRLYHPTGVVAFLFISMFQICELGICVASSNESGNLVCREVCSFLLAESASSRRAGKNGHQEASFLLGCIDHAKLEITYMGNFALRSRTLLAILGSIVGAIIPGLILNA